MREIQTIHVFYALLAAVGGILTVLFRILHVVKKGYGEIKAHKVAVRELLADLAERKPEAMARIAAALDDQTVLEFIRREGKKAKTVTA